MLEKDLEIYDVWESVNGNLFIKMTDKYSIAIGAKGCHEPTESVDLQNTQYIEQNDIVPVKKVGRIIFN